MKKGSSLTRGSLCPRHSKGLLVQGTRKARPMWFTVANLSLSDIATVAGEAVLALLYTNITNGEGGQVL